MTTTLPGTAVELDRRGDVSDFLSSLFAAGGLVLSQVLRLTGLNSHTVQNWVKRKYLQPPVNKKYDCSQFCTIAILNLLGDTFSLDAIRRMLDYAELLCDDAPVLIYTLFAEALSDIPLFSADTAEQVIVRHARRFGLEADALKRLSQIVKIMILAHFSEIIRINAQELFHSLDA